MVNFSTVIMMLAVKLRRRSNTLLRSTGQCEFNALLLAYQAILVISETIASYYLAMSKALIAKSSAGPNKLANI